MNGYINYFCTQMIDNIDETGQLTIFGHETAKQAKRTHNGGSGNPIVFYDYDSFVAKFTDKAKTTDDCYTPKDVYEAVVRYVGEVADLTGKVICRPFYPGGDYENAEYPDNGVVIDNPPFSLFSRIVRFYSESGVPFFLFGPGLTIMNCCRWCTAVIIGRQIRFDNGAKVKCNFASNLFGDAILVTAPELERYIKACESQKEGETLPSFRYPEELMSTSKAQSMSRYGVNLTIRRGESVLVRDLDNHPNKSGLYGEHLLIPAELARAKEAELARAKEAELARAKEVRLSERERRIVSNLKSYD